MTRASGLWTAPGLSDAEVETLARWWTRCVEQPRELPDGLELVHRRLVRAVGTGRIGGPAGESVYLKLMGFPRFRDRLRYAFRALPAEREAELLRAVAAAGLSCPEVLAVGAMRRRGLPWASMLVTRAVETAEHAVDPRMAARTTLALCRVGVEHPDLHIGNFLRPVGSAGDGEPRTAAVLDLQSGRLHRGEVPAVVRQRMAAKLVGSLVTECGCSVDDALMVTHEEGLLAEGELEPVEVAQRRLAAVDRRRRVRRCMRTSTQFEVRRAAAETWFVRRSLGRSVDDPGAMRAVDGGRWLERVWIGDRVRELAGHAPRIAACRTRWSWRGASCRLYIAAHGEEAEPADLSAFLVERLRARRFGVPSAQGNA